MSGFTCNQCGKDIVDSNNGYITGCEHYPVEMPKSAPNRRTNILELIAKFSHHANPVTKSVERSILKSQLDRGDIL